MDPLADKLLIIGALVSLVSLGRLAAWVAMVIIAREVAVTILRTIAAERGLVIAASWLGKAKTVLQIAAVIALIAADPAPAWVDVLVYVALAVTVISGADYFFGLRRRIEQQQRERAAAAPSATRVGTRRARRRPCRRRSPPRCAGVSPGARGRAGSAAREVTEGAPGVTEGGKSHERAEVRVADLTEGGRSCTRGVRGMDRLHGGPPFAACCPMRYNAANLEP